MPVNTQLSILLYTGDFDRIHYALSMATAAAAIDKKVTIFITMAACKAFMCDASGMLSGWKTLPISSGAASAINTEALNDYYAAQGIATFETLLEAAADLSIECIVCETGLRAMQLEKNALDSRLNFISGGLASFLNKAGSGAIISF